MQTQIIALGGGGFSMEPDNLQLDRYILEQSDKHSPHVCFLPTASGSADGYIERFYNAFGTMECVPTHLSLFKAPQSINEFIMEQDIIYVGGGNTKNLLALWKEWGLDMILYRAWKRGTILAGVSAGSICWFEQGLTDSFPGQITPLQCLGFLRGSNCPHFDGEKARRPAYHQFLKEGSVKEGIAADDGVALHYVNGELVHLVSSRKEAYAYQMRINEGNVVEERIKPQFLG